MRTVQDHARKLLLEADEKAKEQAEKERREAEEQAEKAKREAEEQAEKAKREAEEQAKRDSFVRAMNALVKYSSSYGQSGELKRYDEVQASKLAWKALRTAQSDPRLSLFLGTRQRENVVSAVFESVFDLAFRERRLTTTNVKFLSGPKGSGKTTLVWEAAKAAVDVIPRSRVADVVVVKLDVRVFLIVDEFQELFKYVPLGRRFRTQLTTLMNGLEDFETFVMGSPTVGRKVLLNPKAMQDDPRIAHYPGLVGQVDSVNITKISQPARLNRFSGDEALHFLLSCLPELKESTLSDIPRIVNELRGKLHAEPPAIAEQLVQLRERPAWKHLASVLDELRPSARRLVEAFDHTERSDEQWDPISTMEQAEVAAFAFAVEQPVAKLIVTGFATIPVGAAPQTVSWALGASKLPLLNTDFKELAERKDLEKDAKIEADALVDQGVLRKSLDDKFWLSSSVMRLLSLRLLDEMGSCGLHPRQILAMLDATGTASARSAGSPVPWR
ncbi:hypothetical protein FNF29_02619 [Cafeteria roenbergensis]|uniref:Uncharacterized protein n=1 Tax=Cafeteria roenbergensis TaxID=33653 RepID=A0A5A8CLT4_CAFRO|nr:hypothetical protein FNF29_02619 [Cafeteria roenbergensis]|eukprot:KAA0153995.1 hypothetical protein FNF29_02619 [Cafeteria roenbergensis]